MSSLRQSIKSTLRKIPNIITDHFKKSKFEIKVKRLFGENNPNTILREKVEM